MLCRLGLTAVSRGRLNMALKGGTMSSSPAAPTLTRCSGKCRPFVFIVPVHLPGIMIWSYIYHCVECSVVPGWIEATPVLAFRSQRTAPTPFTQAFARHQLVVSCKGKGSEGGDDTGPRGAKSWFRPVLAMRARVWKGPSRSTDVRRGLVSGIYHRERRSSE